MSGNLVSYRLAKLFQKRKRASKCWPILSMVRKRGFEPLRDFSRQPLKLVRLPFRHFRKAGNNHGPAEAGHYI